jgi:integrase
MYIYRRHAKNCGDTNKRCRCRWWCDFIVEGKRIHQSLKTRDKERAEQIARDIEHGAKPKPEPKKQPSFQETSARFLSDLLAQNRAADTIRKYRLLFKQLAPYGVHLSDFTFEVLLDFRTTWKQSPATANKTLDRLKAFFGSCHAAGLIATNPAASIKPATARMKRVQPFSADEQAKILAKPQTSKYRAFVHTLYHSGLRISDCCFLKPADFDGNNIVRQNQKNGAEIFVPIPPGLKSDLDRLPLRGGYYFLIGESTHLGTQTDAWRTVLSDLYKADIPNFHPHRFRHTRVVEWLAHGLTFEEISGMIGTSVKILEKHYASFGPARRQVVSDKLLKLWDQKPKLRRVK